MNFRKSLVVVLMGLGTGLGCAAAAHGQAGVYIGYTGTRLSGIECSVTSTAPCGSGAQPGSNGNVNPSGIQFGGYYDFKTVGPVRLGLDLRAAIFIRTSRRRVLRRSGHDGLPQWVAGCAGSFHTKYSWLSPYAQVSVGYARSNATESPFGVPNTLPDQTIQPRYEDNFLIYQGFVGVDIHVFPLIDLRPVELGIGNMNRFGVGMERVRSVSGRLVRRLCSIRR